MNLAYTEISNEEADRIIKSANLETLSRLVLEGRGDEDVRQLTYSLAKSILSN